MKLQKNNLLIGEVIKLYYIIVLKIKKKKKKKKCFFIGLCINKKKGFLTLANKIKTQKITVKFDLKSPVVIKVIKLGKYSRYIYRVSKIMFKQNKSYFDDLNTIKNKIDSNFNTINYSFYNSAYFKKNFKKFRKRRKKLKRKFFSTQKWRSARIARFYIKMGLKYCEY